MRKLINFTVVSLDGYVEGPNGELDWPNVDAEFDEFSVSQLNDIDTLLFGRVNYEFMAAYWTTAQARDDDPAVADRMNSIPKVVFSTTLTDASWNNSRLVSGDAAAEVARLKEQPGGYLAIFGSPNLTAGLLEAGLVDELRVMIHPILLGAGRSLLHELTGRVKLDLLRTTTFSSGNVLLRYRPA